MSKDGNYKYDVFISYSNSDWEIVQKLLAKLETFGIKICVDRRDFDPGAPIVTEIQRSIDESRKTILAFSPDYFNSKWSELESILAQTRDPSGKKRHILPVFLKSCQDIPRRFQHLNILDLSTPEQFLFQFDKLANAIGKSNLSKVKLRQHNNIYGTSSESKDYWPFTQFLERINKIAFEQHYDNASKTIIFSDLDNFSNINVCFGNDIGDKIMVIIDRILRSQSKPIDIIHWYNDEILLCYSGISIEKTINIAEKMRRAIKEYNWSSFSPNLYVTGSFGVSELKKGEPTIEWILRAIYGSKESKKGGGNSVNLGPDVLPKNFSRRIQDHLS